MTVKICLGRRVKVGTGGFWGIEGLVAFITGYLIGIKNPRKLL